MTPSTSPEPRTGVLKHARNATQKTPVAARSRPGRGISLRRRVVRADRFPLNELVMLRVGNRLKLPLPENLGSDPHRFRGSGREHRLSALLSNDVEPPAAVAPDGDITSEGVSCSAKMPIHFATGISSSNISSCCRGSPVAPAGEGLCSTRCRNTTTRMARRSIQY